MFNKSNNLWKDGKTFVKQDISGWNMAKVTTWTNFRTNSALSTANTPPKFR